MPRLKKFSKIWGVTLNIIVELISYMQFKFYDHILQSCLFQNCRKIGNADNLFNGRYHSHKKNVVKLRIAILRIVLKWEMQIICSMEDVIQI